MRVVYMCGKVYLEQELRARDRALCEIVDALLLPRARERDGLLFAHNVPGPRCQKLRLWHPRCHLELWNTRGGNLARYEGRQPSTTVD